MGGMKSGTGDVWGGNDDEDESVQEEENEAEDESAEAGERDQSTSRGDSGFPSESESRSRETARSDAGTTDDPAPNTGRHNQDGGGAKSTASEAVASSDDDNDSGNPYVVRRMLKDKSVQFERDERLTLFVHDDVKAGEQELETHAQDLFGRDIPVFDIREAVYRAALRNREDVVDELEEMGYTRE